MDVEELLSRLTAGVTSGSQDAGVRLTTVFEPSGGPGTRVMPPTYPGGYVQSSRHVGWDEPAETVLLDSFQSQANRIESALLDARDEGRVALPMFEMRFSAGDWPVRLTSLDFPHRYADAYLRDSTIDGVKFDKTEIGRELRIATMENAGSLYRYDPVSLVLGAWNSHRKGRQPKFARTYKSEVLGVGVLPAARKGGRLDPFNLSGAISPAGDDGNWDFKVSKAAKGEKLSEIGHGNALSGDDVAGGVTVKEVRRVGFLSFAALSRLRFPGAAPEAQGSARAALAALALAGDRLAFGGAGVVFRSGCELTVRDDELAWERRGGDTQPLSLDVPTSTELFRLAAERAADAGIPMETATVQIEPIDGLRKAIDHAFQSAAAEA